MAVLFKTSSFGKMQTQSELPNTIMEKNILNIGIIQYHVSEDININLKKIEGIIEKNNNCDIFVLPELFATGFILNDKNTKIYSKNIEEQLMQWLKLTATKNNCCIVASIAAWQNNEIKNRIIWMRPNSDFLFYDKKHLFRMSKERDFFKVGNEKCIVNEFGWNFCLNICYDLRFPKWLRNTYKNEEYLYDVLVFCAAWPISRINHWKTLISARAIENMAYCIGANHIGVDRDNITQGGNSICANAIGETKTLAIKEENILLCVLDKNLLKKQREDFKVALDWD